MFSTKKKTTISILTISINDKATITQQNNYKCYDKCFGNIFMIIAIFDQFKFTSGLKWKIGLFQILRDKNCVQCKEEKCNTI